MSALTGIADPADDLACDPTLAPVREAVIVATELVPELTDEDPYLAADLVASLAIMEHCAAEAMYERGGARERLLEIARGKASRAHGALQLARTRGAIDPGDLDDAEAALDHALDALEPDEGPLVRLLRRWPSWR